MWVRATRRTAAARRSIGLALLAPIGTAAPALAAPAPAPAAGVADASERAVVAGIERRAHPLRTTEPGGASADLAALSRMAKGATVVGLGEATHRSKELFRLKERVFRHLVQRDGFRVFSLETSWSAGARLDAYVTRGEGDLRQIMREEFQFSFEDWNNEEFLALFTWMREHNRTAAPGERVRVMGNDIADVNRSQYDRVLRWAEEHRPALAPELRQRYAGLLALPASTGERMKHLSEAPIAERKAYDRDARAAYRALEQAGGVDPWVLQEARVIAQMTALFSYDFDDPKQVAEHHRHRDRAMAEKTVWWQRQTGDRILVSAHNAHLGYESSDPASYPVMEGARSSGS
ncbi:erythromycin esterase family protein [Streptomyces sp. NPDC047315]|uniref:erythromycin esterase family protein n=1 Tax=Streptomyces sp. NPDC047315 TaxID=3155142 RepID=UPI0033D61174